MQVKGYKILGVPLGEDVSSPFSSFLYVRQHSSKAGEDLPQGRTLFLANVPARTGVDTGAYLKEAFARYGEVEEVRVKDDPDDDIAASYTSKCSIGFVVFRTSKALKAVLCASGDASRLSPPSRSVLLPGYKPSKRQLKKQQQQQQEQPQHKQGREKEDDKEVIEDDVQQMVRRFRARLPQGKVLEEEVDSYMASFEVAEAEAKRKRLEAATTPDADGFVTVSYGKKRRRGGGGGAGNEEANGGEKRSRSGSHKKKKQTELKNFYAHQMREAKREQLARLRTRFEEDKARIERMKAARKFKPFG